MAEEHAAKCGIERRMETSEVRGEPAANKVEQFDQRCVFKNFNATTLHQVVEKTDVARDESNSGE